MKSLRCFLFVALPLFILLSVCTNHQPPSFWPRNGVRFEDVTWEVPLADSAFVLPGKNGRWELPGPPKGIPLNISSVLHQKPENKSYKKLIGRIDQETFRVDGPILREFYRFARQGVLLLGYEGADSTRLLTIFEPPMVMVPPDPGALGTELISESKSKAWDAQADTFMQSRTTRLRLKMIRRGTLLMDMADKPAVLCRMSLSQDRMVGFGGAGLIVPDAVMLESRVLFAEGIGPVLEWGVRSRRKKEAPAEAMTASEPGLERPEDFEYCIEVILHKRVKAEP